MGKIKTFSHSQPGVCSYLSLNVLIKKGSYKKRVYWKNKRRLHDRKTGHFKAITNSCHASVIADHVTTTGHSLKWDHFDIRVLANSV